MMSRFVTCCKLLNPLFSQRKSLTKAQDQIRTAFVLKRKTPAPLSVKDGPRKSLRARHYVYELVEDTSLRKHENIEVILTKYVEGLGNAGDVVSVKPNFAYKKLLLPGFAVYKSPENLEKYAKDEEDIEKHSSPFAQKTADFLSRMILSICMNKEIPWTLEPWHVRMAFRRAGIIVPEEAITMPSKPIKGPDLNLDSKEFCIKVTINNLESAVVRCRIRHWSPGEDSPWLPNYRSVPSQPLFPEEAELLNSLPPPPSEPKVKSEI